MTRPDRFDYIGYGIVALIAALWVAHIALPAPPPEPAPVGIGAPPGGVPLPALPQIQPRQ